jgi:hypothetical protein
MEKRAKAVEGVAADLLGSAMNGQMQPGDQLGIWSYNQQLYAGVAPMQTWDPARSNLITSRTIEFLSRQVYRDTGQIEYVLPELLSLFRESRQLNVVWFSDGSQKFLGTPFDEELNAANARLRASLEQSRMPVVTVLRGYHGKLTAQNVSLAPWPVVFPAFTNEATKASAALAAPKRVPNTNNMIVMGPGKKADPVPVPTITASDPGVNLRPPPAENVGEPTNVVAPLPSPTTVPVVSTPAPPAPVATPGAVAAVVPPGPQPVNAAPPAGETRPIVPAANVVSAPSSPAAVPPPRVEAPAPAPAPSSSAATATATSGPWGRWALLLGCGFMVAAAVVAVLLARRSRRPVTSSLITQSFDRDRK